MLLLLCECSDVDVSLRPPHDATYNTAEPRKADLVCILPGARGGTVRRNRTHVGLFDPNGHTSVRSTHTSCACLWLPCWWYIHLF